MDVSFFKASFLSFKQLHFSAASFSDDSDSDDPFSQSFNFPRNSRELWGSPCFLAKK
ncbi:hypothetical protein [Lapidilactobacillus salsurivasis]